MMQTSHGQHNVPADSLLKKIKEPNKLSLVCKHFSFKTKEIQKNQANKKNPTTSKKQTKGGR